MHILLIQSIHKLLLLSFIILIRIQNVYCILFKSIYNNHFEYNDNDLDLIFIQFLRVLKNQKNDILRIFCLI
jgi:hypothetical protein